MRNPSYEHAPKWLVVLGGGALLLATLVDSFAVIGRHLSLPVLGSIELVQFAALVAAASALVVATLLGCHARVRLLLDNVSPRKYTLLLAMSYLLSIVFFAALLGGSVWVFVDMIGQHEETEILLLPLEPLRILTIFSCLAVIGLLMHQLIKRAKQ